MMDPLVLASARLAGTEDKVVSFPVGPKRVLKFKDRDFLYQ